MSTPSTRLPPNPYDQAARFLFRLDPIGFLCWLLAVVRPAFRFAGWLDTRSVPFPGDPERTCDTVADLREMRRSRWRAAFVVEFQARPDRHMLYRLLEYVARLLQALHVGRGASPPCEVGAAVVNLTGRRQPQELTFQLPGVPQVTHRFGVAVRNLAEEEAATTLKDIRAGMVTPTLLGFVPLMRGGSDPAIIEEWKQVAATERSAEMRANYRDLALVFAELAKNRRAWAAGLRGWNEMRSALVESWKDEARVEEARELLLGLGARRFGTPDALVARTLEEIRDEKVLRQLAMRVLDVQTWGDLLGR